MFCVILLAGACGKSVCAGRRAALLNSGKGDILCHPMPPVIFLLLRCSALRAMRVAHIIDSAPSAYRWGAQGVSPLRMYHAPLPSPLHHAAAELRTQPPARLFEALCRAGLRRTQYRRARVCIRLLHELCAQPRDEPLYRRAGRPACDVYARPLRSGAPSAGRERHRRHHDRGLH